MLTQEVQTYIRSSVLCWLATCNRQGEPNVSPKEVFTYWDETTLLIANIASPQSVSNIAEKPKVCVSFINIFIQKGFKLKGVATIISRQDAAYTAKVVPLRSMVADAFPILSVIEIKVNKVESIKAPSYFLYPNITEEAQINNAMETYRLRLSKDLR
jgi:predicted pyridoxine 5'-phosphate oxidase superfamily flavin-nucleotide-binding protein